MLRRRLRALAAATALLPAWCWAPAARAQFSKPEIAVEYRQSALFLMGNHMARIKAQLDVSKPNLDIVRASAALIDTLKTLPFEAFVQGTSDVGDTAAKPEIWTERERFDKLARDMQDRVAQLAEAARNGNVAAIRTAFGEAGKACKSCHDDYRRKR
jgi:cytochrome c556